MTRLANVAWKLRKSAGNLCLGKSAATGLTFDYIGAYSDSDGPLLRQVLGLTDMPQVAAVVPGSPADLAGIEVGDDVLAVGKVSVSRIGESADDSDLLADELEKWLAATPQTQQIELLTRRGQNERVVVIRPVRLCATRFVLKTRDGKKAFSDGENVALSTGMIRFAAIDDELALIAGHELGHVINRDREAKSIGERRRMEDRADALGAALAHCAGYDVWRSADFWVRYHKQDRLRWFRVPTHRSGKARARQLKELQVSLTCPVALTN
ncbi:MAG: PDZ domain-containing protein [Novosphingobium sp.]|nr:PDZ domain-containing protein [Novosphingobium sp.]